MKKWLMNSVGGPDCKALAVNYISEMMMYDAERVSVSFGGFDLGKQI